jgi:hypothetical protein
LKPSRYYSYGCRVLNVLHTRLRHRSSNLNADFFRVNLTNDPGCVCGWVIIEEGNNELRYNCNLVNGLL